MVAKQELAAYTQEFRLEAVRLVQAKQTEATYQLKIVMAHNTR